jgi:enoyl-CoA hydratase/carnithine racemase
VTGSYDHLRTTVDAGVADVMIDNPPINLLTPPLFVELSRLADQIEGDDGVRVLVLRSANPEWWIAHYDVEAILRMPRDAPPARRDELQAFHALCERFRTMPKATIACIGGRVGGGGAELAASCDMRFGAMGRTVVAQMEVALGILPGGSGTQRLPWLVGRGRALEIILGSDDLDAETAERWGWLNRALPPGELDGFVTRLARRIASFSPAAVAAAKAAVVAAEPPPEPGLREEAYLLETLVRTPQAQAAMTRFLELGGQTPDGERRVSEISAESAAGGGGR